MELNQIDSFVALAEKRSFTEAAKVCGVTRSAVSHQIGELEEEVGALFIRSNMQLTEAGEILLRHARKIQHERQMMAEEVAAAGGRICGTLRIGVGSFVEPYIRKAANELLKFYPDLVLDVKVEQAKWLNQKLQSGMLDVAFTLNNAYETEDIESRPCIPIKICAVVKDTHYLAKEKEISLEDVKKNYLIMPDESSRSFRTVERFAKASLEDLKPMTRVYINNADAAFSEVIEMNWMTFSTPAHIINKCNLVAIPIKELNQDIMCNVHFRKSDAMKNATRALLNAIETVAIPYFKSIIV